VARIPSRPGIPGLLALAALCALGCSSKGTYYYVDTADPDVGPSHDDDDEEADTGESEDTGEEDTGEEDTGPPPDTGDTDPPLDTSGPLVVPAEGHWFYQSSAITDTSCSVLAFLMPITPGEDGFKVPNPSETGFTMILDEIGLTIACAPAGSAFRCPAVPTEWTPDGLDGTLTYTLEGQGVLFDADNMQGAFEFDASCAGPSCKEVEAAYGFQFPCGFEVEFTASHE
jgi:hypothetical protein